MPIPKRTKTATFRVSKSDKEKLDELAEAIGVSASDVLRMSIRRQYDALVRSKRRR